MAGVLESKPSSNGASSTSLTRRNPATPTCRRNSCIIRTSGIRWSLGKRANRRQPRCSGNIWSNRLTEWAGVSSTNKCRRHNCAVLKDRWRPPVAVCGQCWQRKSSGMKGESSSSKALVPVVESNEFMPPSLPRKTDCVRMNLIAKNFRLNPLSY
jgi:hypothetical protein